MDTGEIDGACFPRRFSAQVSCLLVYEGNGIWSWITPPGDITEALVDLECPWGGCQELPRVVQVAPRGSSGGVIHDQILMPSYLG